MSNSQVLPFTRYNDPMLPIDDDYFICIGKILTFAGAIDAVINDILALEYVGLDSNAQRPLIDDLFDTDKLSFRAKVDLLLRIMKRRNISFNIIDKRELKSLVEVRNHVAHFYATPEFNQSNHKPSPSMEIKLRKRSSYMSLKELKDNVQRFDDAVMDVRSVWDQLMCLEVE